MPIIIHEAESKSLTKKQITVPKELVGKLEKNKQEFGKYKDTDGYKRLSAIVDDDYNKRSDRKDRVHNDDKTVSFGDLRRIDHDMRHMTQNPSNLEYKLIGGDEMRNWAHDELKKQRTSVKQVQPVPQVPKLQKDPTKPKDTKKDLKIGKANVRITDSRNITHSIIISEQQLALLNELKKKNKEGQE